MCITESLCYIAEINTTLYINYTSIKKIFLNNKNATKYTTQLQEYKKEKQEK